MKPFTAVESCFKTKIITVKLKASLLLNVLLCIRTLTILTEALRLSGSPFIASAGLKAYSEQ